MQCCSPYTDFPAWFEYIAAAVFGTDIVLSFFRCYYSDEVLITDRLLIAKHYLRYVNHTPSLTISKPSFGMTASFRREASRCNPRNAVSESCELLLPVLRAESVSLRPIDAVDAMANGMFRLQQCRLRFWVDIIALLPFDYVIIEAVFPPCFASNTARYVSILKLLRLV